MNGRSNSWRRSTDRTPAIGMTASVSGTRKAGHDRVAIALAVPLSTNVRWSVDQLGLIMRAKIRSLIVAAASFGGSGHRPNFRSK
ncbi:hypothetical protein [Sphingomonas sp. STIS6.2]|uniref:hypothetical protein n=1 Tax=Sphingomonas sp. STIS6.2 TaxID=1379700 RepID=UPI0004DB7D3D|nr:hypothetical protein [Sphingomonas sp. STIS6.2]